MNAGRKREGLIWAVLTVALLPATYYLWLPGLQTTMDGLYHKSRFFELDWLLRYGVLYPRWLPHQGFLYGFPTLHYYAPLIYYIAEGFHLLGWGFLSSYEWMVGLGLVAAGWTMFFFARRWGLWAGGVAAIAYTYWVYHFSLAYVRGAQAELWGMVWYPLVLAFVDRIFREGRSFPHTDYVALALVYAALILTHNLSALLFTPVAAVYLLFSWAGKRERLRLLGWVGVSVGVGLLLSAFYWLPVLLDIGYVRVGHVKAVAAVDSLASLSELLSPYWIHRYQPFQGTRSAEPLGRVALLLWALAFVLAALRWSRWERSRREHMFFFALLTVLAILGLSRWSTWVWEHVPGLVYIQFPWRLESLVGLGLAMNAGLAWGEVMQAWKGRGSTAGRYLVAAGMVLTLGLAGLGGLPYDVAKNPATWNPLREEDIHIGLIVQYDYLVGLAEREYGGVWPFEYLPVWASAAREDFFLPPASPPPDAAPLPMNASVLRQHPYDRRFQVDAAREWTFSSHQFYFPAWQVEVDGHPVDTFPRGTLGLVSASIPPGSHEVRLSYVGTKVQRWATLLTLIGGMIWLILAWRGDPRWMWVPILVGVFFLRATWPAWTGQAVTQHDVRHIRLGDRIRLVGSRVLTPRVHPGERVWFTLDWLALAPPQRRYKVIVHLCDAQGHTLANGDTEPGFFFTPTTRWMQGEIMQDWYSVEVPEDLPPGTYYVLTGMYDAETVRPLPIRGETRFAGRVLVGEVQVSRGRR